jgi:murein DD-endopeptidase MepM/ murein hydrolase activator NlpD
MEKENEELEKQIEDLKKQQSQNRTEIKQIVAERNLVEQQVGLLYAQINNMNEQIAAYNVLIADKQEELSKAQAYLMELNEKNKERIRAMEEDGSLSYWSVLFQANSFSDLLDRLNMIEEIAASDQRRLKEMSEAAKEVAEAEQILQTERDELKMAKEALSATQAELEVKTAEAEELLRQLIAKGEEFDQLEGELEGALEDLEIEIGKMEVELDEAIYREHMATATTAPTVRPGSNAGIGVAGRPVTDGSGIQWLMPCDYFKVSSAFGWRIHPVYKDWRHHNGVDLAAHCLMKSNGTTDSPIIATRAGVVIISKYSSSAGWYVTIDHLDGFRSTYMHMCCKPFVAEGDVVAAGQLLGCIGTTGTSTGDHLHFGIYLNGNPVNPMDYIG